MPISNRRMSRRFLRYFGFHTKAAMRLQVDPNRLIIPRAGCAFMALPRGRVFFNRARTRFRQVEGRRAWVEHRCPRCGARAARFCGGCGAEQRATRQPCEDRKTAVG